MVNSSVLVLNQNYEPLNVCNARRAVVLVDRGKAEVLEHGQEALHSATTAFIIPSVIRLVYMIRRPRPQPRLTRQEIFARDGYTCQYCGRESRELTIDHVIPRRLGGLHTWNNVVSACRSCNHRKAGRTPEEARMDLFREPQAPKSNGYYILHNHVNSHHEWLKFVPGWEVDDDSRPSSFWRVNVR